MNKYIIILLILSLFFSCGKEPFDTTGHDLVMGGTNESETPIPPSNLELTNKGNSSVYVKWIKPDGNVSGYNVYRKKMNNIDVFKKANSSIIKETYYTDFVGLPNNQMYVYTVTSFNLSGEESEYSETNTILVVTEVPLTIDGIKSDEWVLADHRIATDTDGDAPFGSPQELKDLWIQNDDAYLYIGFSFYKCTWSDGVHFGIGISYDDNGGYNGEYPTDPWGYNDVKFGGDFLPELMVYISNTENENINSIKVYYDYTESSHGFQKELELERGTDFENTINSNDEGWIELRIDMLTTGLINADNIKINLWSTQYQKTGPSDIVPSNVKTVTHNDPFTFTEYAEYTMQ